MKNIRMRKVSAALGGALLFVSGAYAQTDLSGQWSVKLQDDPSTYPILLPGTTDLAGIGTADTLTPLLKKPQLLHLTRKNSFVGKADYSREIEIPREMAGKPLRLVLERVMWRSCPKIDGVALGECRESLTTPHEYLIPGGLSAGKHTLTLEIDNDKLYEISSGNLAHSYTNDTQIMWNGVLGRMSLDVVPEVALSDVQIYPDVKRSAIDVMVVADSRLKKKRDVKLTYSITGLGDHTGISGERKVKLMPGSDTIRFSVTHPALTTAAWSEFNPQVLTLNLALDKDGRSVDFGMRNLESMGNRLMLNGSPVFLRGTLECCIFPLTGNPPTDDAGWEKVFTTAREWGLNHLRFHSWCPPEAAFRVADRMGFYLQVELPLWSTSIEKGEDGANGEMKRFIKDEYDNIIKAYGNHPSFCLMTVGNELQKDFDWLNEMTAYMHERDPRHLYAASSFTFERGHGGHAEPNDDFLVTQWTDQGWVRGQGVFNSEAPAFNKNYASSTAALTVPLIEHEIGQYAVYPDLKEIDRYTGVLTPHNLVAVRNDLEAKGRLDRAEEYLQASGKLAALLYKEEIERAVKTPGVSGFQLLGLQDFPGQGTALVGLVNSFWESKGVAEAGWFRNFCSPMVALADFDKAAYQTGEPFEAGIVVADYGPDAAPGKTVNAKWILTDSEGSLIANGSVSDKESNAGVNQIGNIKADLSAVKAPAKLTFTVELLGEDVSNSWPIWVYPEFDRPVDFGIVKATSSIDEALGLLEKGETVLLSPGQENIKATKAKFVPVFWSPVHFPHEAGAMGITCKKDHPALASFPNDGHTDWQWWHTLTNASYVSMDDFPGAEPVIEMVDNFTTNRPLAIMMEANVGKGKLLLSTASLLADELHPTQRQLLESIVSYMNSDSFRPSGNLDEEAILKLKKHEGDQL